LPAESIEFGRAKRAAGGTFGFLDWSIIMQTDHPKHHKRPHSAPSLWVDRPVDDALSLLENALREDRPVPGDDEHHDEVRSLREENARLRRLLASLPQAVR